jgi:hypothetical protein
LGLTDEGIAVCTADMTDLHIILIKIEIFASAKIHLNFAAGKLSLERSEIITPPQGGLSLNKINRAAARLILFSV